MEYSATEEKMVLGAKAQWIYDVIANNGGTSQQIAETCKGWITDHEIVEAIELLLENEMIIEVKSQYRSTRKDPNRVFNKSRAHDFGSGVIQPQ